ncbi:MAG: outer membrane beta-barrel protein [Acidobacteriales bacterium]|nr:outer membrane beta-barrel protein [Terriglobales bacterium]
MNRKIIFAVLALAVAVPCAMQAQKSDHVEVGVFADYTRLSAPTPEINFVGVGGRLGFNIRPSVALEAEMSYDFARNYTSTFNNGLNTNFVQTSVRPITALFGPKFESHGPVRAFVTGKVGFVNFDTTNKNLLGGFTSGVSGIAEGGNFFALYPGVGVEGFLGPVGLRLEVGDNIYFDNGAQNNLKVSVGPQFRF